MEVLLGSPTDHLRLVALLLEDLLKFNDWDVWFFSAILGRVEVIFISMLEAIFLGD